MASISARRDQFLAHRARDLGAALHQGRQAIDLRLQLAEAMAILAEFLEPRANMVARGR
jgi:hypothetical protein